MSKIILDLCGGTGLWSKPYREAGYDVRVVTLPENDVLTFTPPSEAYGVLAAPPCTMFSLARTTAKTPRDFEEGMSTVSACLKIIWATKPKWWALENPRGLLRRFLGKPAFVFEHWNFGDQGIKPTDIWGYFNPPAKHTDIRPLGLSKRFPNGRLNAVGWSKSGDKRAITPKGFAKAFFEANP